MSARKQGGHLSVVQPPQPPAGPAPRAYADFDKWVALGRSLGNYYDRLAEMIDVPDTVEFNLENRRMSEGNAVKKLAAWAEMAKRLLAEVPREKLTAKVAKYREGWAFYERDELYDEKYDAAKGTKWRLGRRVICEQMATLIGSYANAAPGSPETYAAMMIEEIVTYNPGAVQLEAACRWVRRNCKFPPSIAEMLQALREVETGTGEFNDQNPGEEDCYIIWLAEMLQALREVETGTGEFNDQNPGEEDCYIIWAHKELETAVAQQATSELVMALALALLRAELAGGADALGEAMTAAEAQHGHRAFMAAFDVFDRLRRDLRDGRRSHAIRELAEAMGSALPVATRAGGQTPGAKVQVAPGRLPPGQDAPRPHEGKPQMRFGA